MTSTGVVERTACGMQVKIYATLRDLLGHRELEVEANEGDTVREVLRRLASSYPPLASKLWDHEEKLTGQVTILVNGRLLPFVGGPDTGIHPSDDLKLFPPIGGG
jgi:sulfur-carrier protein